MKLHITTLTISLLAAAASHAAVSPQEAAELGKSLTPWGATVAGNQAGTIPAYTGGLPTSTRPADFKPDSGFWANPYADDKPLFVINTQNVEQYSEQLSDGTKALIKRFPETYSVTVYPSRRSANYPDWVNENSIANATRCKTIEQGVAVDGCFGGVPFPIPKTGNEVVWNAQLHYKGSSFLLAGQGWYVDAKGSKVLTGGTEAMTDMPYYDRSLNVETFYAQGGMYTALMNVYNAPARNVGEGNMMKFYVNPVKNPNATWNYSPGQRRVRRAPDAEYDFPVATSGGAMFYDEAFMYSGKQDRYDYKYLGKTEMIIPYNNYEWDMTGPDTLLGERHPNPAVMRWELHRVHVVELVLMPGMRHALPKRRLYYDEDILSAGMSDGWDASGKLAKATYMPSIQMYDKQIPHASATWLYDFATGVYYHSSIHAASTKGIQIFDQMKPAAYFTPESLARRSQR